jgi:hypothetical protein
LFFEDIPSILFGYLESQTPCESMGSIIVPKSRPYPFETLEPVVVLTSGTVIGYVTTTRLGYSGSQTSPKYSYLITTSTATDCFGMKPTIP